MCLSHLIEKKKTLGKHSASCSKGDEDNRVNLNQKKEEKRVTERTDVGGEKKKGKNTSPPPYLGTP